MTVTLSFAVFAPFFVVVEDFDCTDDHCDNRYLKVLVYVSNKDNDNKVEQLKK